MKYKKRKLIAALCVILILCGLLGVTALAAGDVSGAIETAWKATAGQIKSIVDKVVFPALDMILAIFFFVKLAMCYFDYRKHGQFEFTAPVILFACLVFTLTAPLYIWQIIVI